MWKLTIIQKKQYDTFKSDQEVVYTSNNLGDLLLMINNSEKFEPSETKYTIERVVE